MEIRSGQDGFLYIEGLTEVAVDCMNDVKSVIQKGKAHRAVGATNMNEHSSRSHSLLCINVQCKNELSGEQTKSKLYLIDLAG